MIWPSGAAGASGPALVLLALPALAWAAFR
ncbi:hypothetical protein ABH940_003327 [Streptacidiphilus sp. BW17]